MKPREIVQRTLDFNQPERVARSFEPSDFTWGGPQLPNPEGAWVLREGTTWERKDEWGNLWRRLDPTSKGEVAQGAIHDLAQIDRTPFPDFSRREVYAEAQQIFQSNPDHYHIGSLHGLTFSVARKLRRMEQYLMDLVSEPEAIHRLNDRVDEQIRWQITRLAQAGADCVMIAEDWGTQLDLLISPKLWRQEFKPRFFDLVGYTHELGLKFFMHSCGKMTAIIPDLIQTGVDLLQFDQPTIHGIDLLAATQEKAHISYWCPVDIQKTLQSGDPSLIRAEAHQMLEKLWRGRGGFVAGFYSDEASLGLGSQWQAIAIEEFMKGRQPWKL